jgi:hypothetical protein
MEAAEELLQRSEKEYKALKKKKLTCNRAVVNRRKQLDYLQGYIHGIKSCMTVFKTEAI